MRYFLAFLFILLASNTFAQPNVEVCENRIDSLFYPTANFFFQVAVIDPETGVTVNDVIKGDLLIKNSIVNGNINCSQLLYRNELNDVLKVVVKTKDEPSSNNLIIYLNEVYDVDLVSFAKKELHLVLSRGKTTFKAHIKKCGKKVECIFYTN